jgi:transposase
MNSKPRNRYTAEFKAQALELLTTGKPVTEVAKDLCISTNLLYYWKSRSQSTQLGSEGPRAVGERAAADELRALRRENTHLKAENDILKKAAVILGTKTPPSSAK